MEEKQWNILTLSEQPERIEAAAAWFHEKWNIPQQIYRESMEQSKEYPKKIPQWYIAVGQDGRILGGLGVIENDFHKRQDLRPNICAVYVEKAWRGQGMARALLAYACTALAEMGEKEVFLLTDHVGFYEACGWEFWCMAEELNGGRARVYRKALK